ncbi:hypothetical protein ACF0H5_018822 [Mactra antiquata]
MNKKQDVREKVKEIKLRQQNWLKQRAESKDIDNDERVPSNQQISSSHSPAKSYNYSPAPRDKNLVTQSSSKAKQNESLAQSLIASKKSNARFKSWLKAKHEHDSHDDNEERLSDNFQRDNDNSKPYRKDRYLDNTYSDGSYRDHKGSGNVNILTVPSNRSPGYASPDPSWNSDDETGEITAASLLSPEDFDSKADDIIAKVKGDMGLNGNRLTKGYSPGKSNIEHNSNVELSSHVCSTCDKLMMAPMSTPMLLIPCGHTLCNVCCKKTKYCAICGCSVQSFTPNIMLQQIITNYHSKQQQQHARRKTGATQKSRSSYREEYQNLETRQEILHEELANISKSVDKMNRRLDKDRQQLSNIERKERNIEEEIETLQEQLKELREHKHQYERGVYELEMETKQEKNRLILVKDSLKSVEQQMEKVRFLAEEDS